MLQYTVCKSPTFPEIEAFIKSGLPAKYPNLELKAVEDLDPMIILLDKHGVVEHKEDVKNWTTEDINTYINTHLEKINISEATV
ncbi:unnamed protein product [Arctia plantaginis]|uniref:Selenoprotein F n=1 Tax=Arctia plantaginis TaxID=874455 RepID=A0A8S1BGP6_ARCPL|nr:unnamed protein product [Arctia plantaginis]